MSTVSLKSRLIHLIQGGYFDDVRCEILIHLKENPRDDEVWEWCVATARSDEDRLRAVKQWLKVSPNSPKAKRVLRVLETSFLGRGERIAILPSPPEKKIKQFDITHAPFNFEEFIVSLFTGQKEIVAALTERVEVIKGGRNLSFLLRAPEGWGKTLLASLVVNYLDPQLINSLQIDGSAIKSVEALVDKRFLLVEEFQDILKPEQLIALIDDGAHTLIFTTSGTGPLPEAFAQRIHDFTFEEYSLGDLGDIASKRLMKHNIKISPPFMHQLAKFAGGSPKEVTSYAERLSLIWRKQEVSESLGELIFHLNFTLNKVPPDANHNYLAIWEDHWVHAISPDDILARLNELGYPFGINLLVSRSALQNLPENQRIAQLNHEVIALPPFIFQKEFNPAGPVSRALSTSQSKGFVLGAYSELELAELVELCGFVLTESGRNDHVNFRYEPIAEDVQVVVWERDGGCCAICGSQENLAFDHIIPMSKGGSNTARNVQILCETCNLTKRARFND